MALTYKDAGVDIGVGNEAVKRIKEHVKSTFSKEVLTDLGLFGGAFDLSEIKAMEKPVLVSSIDGVGTKTKVAALCNKWDTVGIDIVSHCANDVLCCGAKPLFFLDYLASSKVEPEKVEQIVKGMAQACRESCIALVGGETAEMPGVYCEKELDIVGCIVGLLDKGKIIDGSLIGDGDLLLGLPSSGLHTNGYSLARKALFELAGLSVEDRPEELGCSVGEELLKPHRSYVKEVLALMKVAEVKGIAHITGGGLVDNVPRIIPHGLAAQIKKSEIKTQPVFRLIQEKGGVPEQDMWRTFNMGIGMVLVLGSLDAEKAMQEIYGSYLIGEIVKSKSGEVKFV